MVESHPPGASIYLDGADTGLVAPATVPVQGDLGQEIQLQLRRNGAVAEAVNLALGSGLLERWAPEIERIEITSAPSGAEVSLNGERVSGVTPVEVELHGGDEYDLRIELDGYRTATRTVTLANLNETERDDRVLPFTLTRLPDPGRIVIDAPYAVLVTVRGRRYGPRDAHRITLQPGTYDIEIAAPTVFLRQTLPDVEVQSNQEFNLSSFLPRTVILTVNAEPGCSISIDGNAHEDPPFRLSIVPGPHDFSCEWQSDGSTTTVSEDIGTEGQTVRIIRDR